MEIAEYESLIRECGLSAGEAKIYCVLLTHGAQTAAAIARLATAGRTNAYHVLSQLEQKKLIRKFKINAKTFFEIEHPQRIVALFDQQDIALKKRRAQLATAFDDLVTEYRLSQPRPAVFRFEGRAGMIRAYGEQLKDKLPLSVLMNRTIFRSYLSDFNVGFIKERKKYRIRSRVITTCGNKMNTPDTEELRVVKYIDPKELPFDMDVRVTDKKLVISTLKENIAAGIVVTDPDICRNFLSLFEYLWKQADSTPTPSK